MIDGVRLARLFTRYSTTSYCLALTRALFEQRFLWSFALGTPWPIIFFFFELVFQAGIASRMAPASTTAKWLIRKIMRRMLKKPHILHLLLNMLYPMMEEIR